ncbi:mitochondrial PGP phosphatase-domain-containing protein [Tirmania nivea]|nr:mitochondrial PGP phosphatase-domain-containing protein [Tirmania nivea]
MIGFNLSASLHAFRAIKTPTLLLPHHTVPSFDHLPYPFHRAFTRPNGTHPDIRAVVLDKDNCFTIPHELEVYGPYKERFELLKKEFPGNKLLVVSNSSGTGDDPGHKEATILTRTLSLPILTHTTKKPGCHPSILSFFLSDPTTGVTHSSQIAIIGDRLFTDVMMANMMGSWGLWIRDGVPDVGGVRRKSLFGGVERVVEGYLRGRGLRGPWPAGVAGKRE